MTWAASITDNGSGKHFAPLLAETLGVALCAELQGPLRKQTWYPPTYVYISGTLHLKSSEALIELCLQPSLGLEAAE